MVAAVSEGATLVPSTIVAVAAIGTSIYFSHERNKDFQQGESIFDNHLWGGPGVLSQSDPGGHYGDPSNLGFP